MFTVPAPASADRVRPADMTPALPVGYAPTEADERGLWQVSDKIEKEIAESNLLIRDPALSQYVEGIIHRLLGDAASEVRLYIVRNSDFNASMFPNGMMIVHSGLLARMRNEAQLAAVLGHEAGHYFRRHTLTRWRDIKSKTAIMSIISLGGAAASGASGGDWYSVANAINSTLLLAIFSYSRSQEQEADAYGVRLLAESGYSPHAAADVWQQFIDERKASATARDKRYRDRSVSAISTHPPSAERMAELRISADELVVAAGAEVPADTPPWPESLEEVRWSLLEEQIKLNDAGASLYLVKALSQDGWSSGLHYYLGKAYTLRGKPGDQDLADQEYAAAVEFDKPLPEAFRAHGYAQLRKGNKEAGQAALATYLELKPEAPDAAMIRFSIDQ